ncbi:MAG TPA: RIP metalloprotease RseP [Verrucomicrobiae bacterium]|nr:RIP metalloprotease RseP [Verrucomicrobiae bacterium]
MQALKILFILLEVLLLFNLLIFVHELGHFLAARWRGLKVDRFAIWFGKPIWEKEIKGVIYCLGTIPAGGYVALPQMATMEAIEGKPGTKPEELPPISVLDKIIVAFAGPLFSFGLAFVFAVVVWQIGRPVGESETTTTIGYVAKDSPAEKAGLRPGDCIKQVDGQPVSRFGGIGDSVTWRIVRSEGEVVPVTLLRDGKELTVPTKPTREKTAAWERRGLRQIQVMPLETPLVAKVEPNSPAALGRIKANDVITSINGTKIYHPQIISDEIRRAPNDPVTLGVKRGTNEFSVTLKPVLPEGWKDNPNISEEMRYPRLGIAWESGGRMSIDHPAPFEQVRASVMAMVSTLGAVLSRKSDIGLQHLSGPVGIVRIYYRLFENENGWRLALWFSVVLNVNLALLNLLPIPVLDGGHITLACIEGIRRRPVNVRLIGAIQASCAVIIIGYMLFVTFFDVQFKRGARIPEPRFAPPASTP